MCYLGAFSAERVTLKTFFKWVWRIFVWLLHVAVILYVFEHLVGRTEHIIVSILGLIYVSARFGSIVTALAVLSAELDDQKQFNRIRELLGEDVDRLRAHRDGLDKLEGSIFKAETIVNYIFLGLISLICLLDLFSHLDQGRF